MKQNEFCRRLTNVTPEVPEHFSRRLDLTLEKLASQEQMKKEPRMNYFLGASGLFGRHASVILTVCFLLMTTAIAYAAIQWHMFDSLSFLIGKGMPKNAEKVLQSNLYQETINDVEITVREAAYDGRTLFLQYSYRMLDVDHPFDKEGLQESDIQLLKDHHVGWWIDSIWFNGIPMDIQENSGGVYCGSDVPGEIIVTDYCRMDNSNFPLTGPIQISLPIGDRQNLSEYNRKSHPEKYFANGRLKLPQKGIVTFTYNANDILSQIVTVHPNQEAILPLLTAKVTETVFTPLLTYISMDLQVSADAMERFIQDNGPGYKDQNGTVIFPYGGMDVFDAWIMSLELVDQEGTLLFPDHRGQNGFGNETAEFLYPALNPIPDELFLAPTQDGKADMTQAVRVK